MSDDEKRRGGLSVPVLNVDDSDPVGAFARFWITGVLVSSNRRLI